MCLVCTPFTNAAAAPVLLSWRSRNAFKALRLAHNPNRACTQFFAVKIGKTTE